MREIEAAHLAPLFATPVLEHMWSDGAELNPLLRDRILAHERAHPGTEQSNFGGWHSETGRLEFCGPAGARLADHIRAMISEATQRLYAQFGQQPQRLSWTLSAWANVNRRGHFNNLHTHPGATWSGVYYVDDGGTPPGGEATAIQLFDPNPARSTAFFPELPGGSMRFSPAPGLMILFPSYLPHAVPPHQGDGTRISIAFNVRKEPFP